MTIVSFASLKGAPGVTTLSCLVAAAWPPGRRVVVLEADPCGGDLAARFRLSKKRGWSSFTAAARRLEGVEPLESHLQRLPGGVEVVVGAGIRDPREEASAVHSALSSLELSDPRSRCDLIVDLGRLLPGEESAARWLDQSTLVVLLVHRDAASILQARERAAAIRSRSNSRVGIVIVGSGPFGRQEVQEFIGLPVLEEVPHDPNAGQLAGGLPGGRGRLVRSALMRSAQRIADLASDDGTPQEMHSLAVRPRQEAAQSSPCDDPATQKSGGQWRWAVSSLLRARRALQQVPRIPKKPRLSDDQEQNLPISQVAAGREDRPERVGTAHAPPTAERSDASIEEAAG